MGWGWEGAKVGKITQNLTATNKTTSFVSANLISQYRVIGKLMVSSW